MRKPVPPCTEYLSWSQSNNPERARRPRQTGLMTFPKVTIGLDVGDRYSQVFAVDDEGEVIEEGQLPSTQTALRHRLSGIELVRIVP